MIRYLFLLLLLSNLAYAQVYKWVDENGKTHFSDQPRKGAEAVDLKEHSKSFDSNTREINERIKATSKSLSNEREREARQKKSQQVRSSKKKQYNKEKCQYYKDKLANNEYRWKLNKTQGYKQSQKDRYLIKKDKYKRDIKRYCK